MSIIRVMQISDTHLSPRTRHFRKNNELMDAPLKASDHDLIVHSGDITLDGVRFSEDFELCRDFFTSTGKDIKFIPGNHDVGDNARLSKPESVNGSAISEKRISKFLSYFGTDRWSVDLGRWRFIGINSMLIGSGFTRENEQYVWIDEQLASAGGRHIALFTHQPFYIDEPEPAELTYWTIDPSGHEHVRPLLNDPRLRLIASGHLHQGRSRQHGTLSQQWCSSIAFTTREALVPEMGGTREVGYMEHTFHDDGRVETQPRSIEGFENTYLDDVMDEVYPKY
jgi:Predicted phosphohydrolases